jgi:hypothetical protein
MAQGTRQGSSQSTSRGLGLVMKPIFVMFFRWILLVLVGTMIMACKEESSATGPDPKTGSSATQEITVSLSVPDTAWRIKIQEVYQVGNEIWVISQLQRSSDMGGMMISRVEDRVMVSAPNLPVKHFVFGKNWNWEGDSGYTFLTDREKIKSQLANAKRLF